MTIFMLANILLDGRIAPASLRQIVRDQLQQAVFNRFPALRISFYDARGFQSRCSDVLVWDVQDIAEYDEAIALLESPGPGETEIVIVEVVAATTARVGDEPACSSETRSLLDVVAQAC